MRVGVIRDIVLAADGEVHDGVIVRRGMGVGQLDYRCGVDSGWGKKDSWPWLVARCFICARSGATCGFFSLLLRVSDALFRAVIMYTT